VVSFTTEGTEVTEARQAGTGRLLVSSLLLMLSMMMLLLLLLLLLVLLGFVLVSVFRFQQVRVAHCTLVARKAHPP